MLGRVYYLNFKEQVHTLVWIILSLTFFFYLTTDGVRDKLNRAVKLYLIWFSSTALHINQVMFIKLF